MGTHWKACAKKSGFTLIELLVSISIIGVLISIALPSLKTSREQAKRVVCQSNTKQINTALLTYVADFDSYPVLFKVDPHRCNRVSWATWSFGGWTGRDFETYCDADAQGTLCFQTHERPLSGYIMDPQVIPPDDKGSDRMFGTADDRVTELPVFRCPADEASTQWRWRRSTASQDVKDFSAYDQCGSSYQMNYYWFHQAKVRAVVPRGTCYNFRWWDKAFEVGREVWRRTADFGGAARFVTLAEDPFDWGIAQNLGEAANAEADSEFRHHLTGEQTMGYHGKWSTHVMAFLDGHVDYVKADTRFQREAHWTVTDERWLDTRRRENCPPYRESYRGCDDR